MNEIIQLYKWKQSVFNFADLASVFSIHNTQVLKNKIQYLKKKGVIESPRRGIYTLKDTPIHPFELANKIYSPSYISLYSALYHHKVLFQYPSEVYLIYKKTQIQEVWDLTLKLRTMKKTILLNPSGIIHNGLYSIASAERAFLDTIYLYGDVHLDNLDILDIKILQELIPLYGTNTLEKKALSYFLW